MHENRNEPLVVAHRGFAFGTDFERNTADAFEYALDMGADAIECDLRITVDGEIIVHHDPLIRSNFKIKRISTSTYDQLLTIKQNNEALPTLEMLLSIVNDKVPLFLQIKDSSNVRPILERLQ